MEDITKLSGPELADEVSDLQLEESGITHGHAVMEEAARRLREDTRDWQRRLERERDGLRERVRGLEAQLTLSESRDPFTGAPVMGVTAAAQPPSSREPGCQCHWEVGDSPCRVHGEDESGPAERKAQEERRHGPANDSCSLDELIDGWIPGSTYHDALAHLRETLATLKAAEALAAAWEGHSMARELREVLNGKR